jgi:capsular polysaccharide export protein
VLNRILEERTALEEGAGLESLRTGWLRRQGRKLAVLYRAWTQKI